MRASGQCAGRERVVGIQRLERVREKLLDQGAGAVLINHPPNIQYLSGFTGTNGFLLVTPQRSYLFTDFRYLDQARTQSPLFETVKIDGGLDYEKIMSFLAREGIRALAVEEEYLSVKAFKKLAEKSGERLQLLAANGLVETLRAMKTDDEIEYIIAAVRIADSAFQQVLPFIRPGVSEFDVACELEYLLRKKGAERIPFPLIVASGPRSALPHGVATKKIIRENELVTLDFGAVSGGYCSDMTRTLVVGKPDGIQEERFNLVMEAQELAFQYIKPGVAVTEVDARVRQFFHEQGCEEQFGHGLGHGIGLEVHEKPSLSPRGQGNLEPGMVFSIEPGLYYRDWGGIRLEDLVLLRSSGPERLTRSAKILTYHQ